MRFEDYSPLEDKHYSILDINGNVITEENLPSFSDEELLYLYRTMLFSRIMDEKNLSYQRQGRMLTYAPNIGQEAAQIGSAYAMEKNDWLVPSFRELGAWLVKGVPLKNIFLYWYGNEWGSYMPEGVKVLPVSVPIASQLQHATGIGMANNIKGEESVVVAYVGDGGTSQGDFHEALNFAAVFKAPVVFVIQNNQYAISVSRKEQTASKTLAQKAIAYGMPGILVDGNDIFAVYSATKEAIERARKGGGPTLIEAFTYRLGAHTTSDDPTKYRKDEEVEKWKEKDPIVRFKKYLQNKGILTDEWEENAKKEIEKEVTINF
ncbi:pyruvate dehydrogenase (acetyl-transferring) E1 component subunit alpha [Schnuerera ultunensis]|uniref:Pyruvate dehydrogenase E1 component subunit alpha n=1 Tax=[Clostridium] ultunense Esp TaxID=1288971 RepID=A0A1M4PRV6_9FIRM|nr:pyruvate dehydrogenase (acetyl-transferring) E1 component subunit alpha [Schnuerera ultunensis]SHD78197.1 pyruvate dehydrogenase (E1 alpha subunit) [[Clostridium] ultunense Esp]